MSLDVYLTMPGTTQAVEDRIYVRENGRTVQLTRAEWDARNPGRVAIVVIDTADSNEVFTANITHNLNTMAGAAGIYQHLWRPEELGITQASQLIDPLRKGLDRLRAEPERFKTFNPSNGWGDYEGLISFVEEYLQACEKWPDAEVSVSR